MGNNENLNRLKELTEIMEFDEQDNKLLIRKINKTISESVDEISSIPTSKTKVKYYEKLYLTITNILNTRK
jgi:hypothetical protein